MGPKTREGQRWLDRNGFPNGGQLDSYGKASDQVREQATAAGDTAAGVFLDARKLTMGDEGARDRLMRSASDGSPYALGSLPAYYGGNAAAGRTAYAYSLIRVAEMLGDFGAGGQREFFAGRPLDSVEGLQAEQVARNIYAAIVEDRRRRLWPAASIVDPRPIVAVVPDKP